MGFTSRKEYKLCSILDAGYHIATTTREGPHLTPFNQTFQNFQNELNSSSKKYSLKYRKI